MHLRFLKSGGDTIYETSPGLKLPGINFPKMNREEALYFVKTGDALKRIPAMMLTILSLQKDILIHMTSMQIIMSSSQGIAKILLMPFTALYHFGSNMQRPKKC